MGCAEEPSAQQGAMPHFQERSVRLGANAPRAQRSEEVAALPS